MRRGIATKQLRLGIFTVVGIVMFIGCIYYMGSLRHMFQKTFTLSAVFTDAKGLRPGNNVTFSGINVGTVERIELISDSTVRVFFVIEKDTRRFIRRDAVALISSEGLMGNKTVAITGGTPMAPMVVDNDEIKSDNGIKWDQVAKNFEGAGANTEMITRDLAQIVSSVNGGEGTLGALLKDTVFARQFKEAVVNLHAGTQEFNEILAKVKTDMVDNMAVTSRNAAEASANLNAITKTARDSIMRDLQHVTARLQGSEGTMGKLLNDTAFASTLEQTVNKINHGTDEATEVIEAAKSSWLLRKHFRKKEREEAARAW